MLNKKQVYYNIKFTGFWPIGTAAVVIADTHTEAAALLNLELRDLGLDPEAKPEDMIIISLYQSKAIVLHQGDY